VATDAQVAASDNGMTQLWVGLLAGLVAIALAVWGFIAIGRRKPVDRRAAAVIERPVVTPRAPAPAPEAASQVAAPVPAAAIPAAAVPIRRPAPAAPGMSHSGAAVPLPAKPPESFEERDALLRRMIAAAPDRAN